MYSVVLKNVSKSYSDGSIGLRKINITIPSTGATAVMGRNGCGKTTLIKVICNLIKIDEGEFFFYGDKIKPEAVEFRKRLGVVLSTPNYIESYTVRQYLDFVCDFQQVSSIRHSRIGELINIFSFKEFIDQRIEYLSSGNRMKVSICGAIVHDPDMLLLDEPFVNLDVSTSSALLNVLKQIAKNKAILIASHNVNYVVGLCENFLILENGLVNTTIAKSDCESNKDLIDTLNRVLTKSDDYPGLSWVNG